MPNYVGAMPNMPMNFPEQHYVVTFPEGCSHPIPVDVLEKAIEAHPTPESLKFIEERRTYEELRERAFKLQTRNEMLDGMAMSFATAISMHTEDANQAASKAYDLAEAILRERVKRARTVEMPEPPNIRGVLINGKALSQLHAAAGHSSVPENSILGMLEKATRSSRGHTSPAGPPERTATKTPDSDLPRQDPGGLY